MIKEANGRKGSHSGSSPQSHYFVTGYPGFLARQLVDRIAQFAPRSALSLLVEPGSTEEAERCRERLKGTTAKLLTGDAADMHLGLSGDEYRELCDSVTEIFHLATTPSPSLTRSTARRVNVEGTRNVLELAKESSRLRRFNHLSSCYVAGDRIGVIEEDELERGQTFGNAYEETAYHGERIVAFEAAHLPLTIYRPSSIVGDSQAGEIDRFDGPFYLGLSWLLSPWAGTVPLPGDGAAPINVVPVDFVADAIWALSQDSRSLGGTFHVVDPQPISAYRAFELAAAQMGRKPHRFSLSAKAAEMMLRLPLIEKWAGPHRTSLHYLSRLAFYNCRNLLELLEGTGIRCPRLETYLDKLTRFFEASSRQTAKLPLQMEDPLDPSPQNEVF